MAYMLLVVEPPEHRPGRTEREGHEEYERMVRFGDELKSLGLLTMAQSLKSASAGARVTLRGGASSVLDGPFSEAKELIGGFFLLTCETRAQAIEIARQCPAAQWATIEVRELGPCFQ